MHWIGLLGFLPSSTWWRHCCGNNGSPYSNPMSVASYSVLFLSELRVGGRRQCYTVGSIVFEGNVWHTLYILVNGDSGTVVDTANGGKAPIVSLKWRHWRIVYPDVSWQLQFVFFNFNLGLWNKQCETLLMLVCLTSGIHTIKIHHIIHIGNQSLIVLFIA